jgi:hypothetical protein
VQDSIKSAISSGHGNAIVYAGAIGLLLSDVIPTPADGVYFWLMKKQRDKFNKKEITAKQFWSREAMAYYGLNPIWWGLVLGALYYTKGDYTNKLKVGIGLISAGAVAGVLYKNVKEDEITQGI